MYQRFLERKADRFSLDLECLGDRFPAVLLATELMKNVCHFDQLPGTGYQVWDYTVSANNVGSTCKFSLVVFMLRS